MKKQSDTFREDLANKTFPVMKDMLYYAGAPKYLSEKDGETLVRVFGTIIVDNIINYLSKHDLHRRKKTKVSATEASKGVVRRRHVGLQRNNSKKDQAVVKGFCQR